MTGDLLRSPLGHLADRLVAVGAAGSRIAATEVSTLSQVSLRLGVEDASRSPFALPTRPNSVSSDGGLDVLWLGPDEWLIVAERPARELVASLEEASAGTHRSVVDVSANRAVIDLSGDDRLDVLASGCPLDLHPRSWDDGRCAQTLFGRAQVLLQERAGLTRLFVRPSFGRYVVEMLVVAASSPRNL